MLVDVNHDEDDDGGTGSGHDTKQCFMQTIKKFITLHLSNMLYGVLSIISSSCSH